MAAEVALPAISPLYLLACHSLRLSLDIRIRFVFDSGRARSEDFIAP
jgi:hypothetical protein